MPREIVTLSFGSYASFVSAHYWNLQVIKAAALGGDRQKGSSAAAAGVHGS